jgi:hypothetical protein
MLLGERVDFYFYLESWDSAMDQISSAHQILCQSRKKDETETVEMIRQAFEEDSMSRIRVFEWHSRFRARRRKGETCEEQSQEHDHHFI